MLAALTVVAAITLTACSKKGPSYAKYIPKTSGYVVAFDVKSMMTKLAEDSLTMDNMVSVLNEDSTDESGKALAMWEKFKDAGLDFENKVLLAMPELDMKGGFSVQLVAGLKDAAKLEKFVSELPNAPKPVKEGDISMVTEGELALGWNNDAVMIMVSTAAPSYGMLDMTDSNAVAEVPGADKAKGNIKKFFNLKEDESIASVKAFTELMQETADVAVYTSSESAAGANNPYMAFMPKVGELLKGVYSTSVINFEADKISISGSSYVGPKLSELLKKYAGPVADKSLLERYPSANLGAVAAFSFKPEVFPAVLKETGLDALANMATAESGTNFEEVGKAFKGDFAVIFSDFEIKNTDAGKDALSSMSWQPAGKLVVAARIGDKAAFDKLLGLAEKQQMLVRQGNRIVPAAEVGAQGIYAGIEGDLLVISNDSAIYAGYASGKAGAKLAEPVAANMSNQSMLFYINTPGILKAIPEGVIDDGDVYTRNILARSKEVFGEIWFNSSNFDGKKVDSKGEVKVSGGKNSLSALVKYLMYIAEQVKAKDKAEEAMINAMIQEVNPPAEIAPNE